jgi:hypothetical protein
VRHLPRALRRVLPDLQGARRRLPAQLRFLRVFSAFYGAHLCAETNGNPRAVWGECSHVFHMHCLLKWIGTASSKQQCPMDRRPWGVFAVPNTLSVL